MSAVDQRRGLLSAVLIFTLQLSLSGCQGRGVDADPWAVAEWGVCDPLSDPEVSLSARGVALSEQARSQLEALRSQLPPESRARLISLNALPRNRWSGYVSVDRAGFPLPLEFTLHSDGDKLWVQELTHLEQTLKLSTLIDQLPLLNDSPLWEGGLIGRDSRGRTLSPVVIAWIPPLVYIDGHPLEGEATREAVMSRLRYAFSTRSTLAAAAQSSYTPHVALALAGDQSARELDQLMTWCELSGADQVSLITQTSQNTPTLFYLASRGSVYSLLSPQRHLRGHLKLHEVALDVKRTDQDQAESLGDQLKLNDTSEAGKPQEREALEALSSLLSRARERDSITGVVLHIEASARVHDVIAMSRLIRTLDPSIPITLIGRGDDSGGETQ